MRMLPKLSALIATSVAFSFSAYASDWTGGDGNWSSDGNPGWNGTGVPNAAGAVANFSDGTITGNPTTAADVPATVGTINLNATGNVSRAVTTTANLTMDQDDAGPGFAIISNTDPNTGTNNFLNINGSQNGTLVIADDLLVTNTGGSTAPNDAILIGASIQGTGNVTFSTVGNTFTDQNTAPGSIRIIQPGTFVGNVLVQKGVIMTNAGTPAGGAFGDPGNMVTLGQAGQGDVTVMATANNVDIPNPFTVASGTGGTTTIGSANIQGSTFGGNITLNGNLTVNSWVTLTSNPGAFILGGTISGAGGLTFTTTTQVNGGDPTKILSEVDAFTKGLGVNTYAGGTIINAGTLIADGNGALGLGSVTLAASNVQLTLLGHSANKIADTATLSLFNSSDTLNLNFNAARLGPEKVGALIINGVSEAPGIYGAPGDMNANFILSEITGTGELDVLGTAAVPEPQTLVVSALTAGVMVTSFFRKRIRC